MSGGDLEKKKVFLKLTVRTHDLEHLTEATLATPRHNHLTTCPLSSSSHQYSGILVSMGFST